MGEERGQEGLWTLARAVTVCPVRGQVWGGRSGRGFEELKSQVPVRDPVRRSSRCLGRWSQSAGDGDINLGVSVM